MKTKIKFAISAVIFGAIGSFYLFVPYKIVKTIPMLALPIKPRHLPDGTLTWNILRHNDHVMIGTIGLVIAIVSVYAIIRNKK